MKKKKWDEILKVGKHNILQYFNFLKYYNGKNILI